MTSSMVKIALRPCEPSCALGVIGDGRRRLWQDPRILIRGGSDLANLISRFDWASTPLGPRSAWPAAVATTLDLILRSPLPIATLWGAQGILIYNDACAAFAGGRHPQLLGMPVREGLPEVGDFTGRVMEVVLAGRAISYRNKEFTLSRGGTPERVWLNLDCSPVVDRHGSTIGVMAVIVETTEIAHATRRLRENEARLRFLDTLGKETAKSTDADTILADHHPNGRRTSWRFHLRLCRHGS